MEFQEVVRRRRMIRTFDPRPLPPEVVDRVLANALRAPSAGFSQGWGFLVLQTPEERALFWSTAGADSPASRRPGMPTAPLIVVPMSHKDAYLDRYASADKGWTDRDEARWPVPYWHIDTGMAALLMLLTAVDAGLGACFIGIMPDRIPPFRAAFGVPESYTPIGAVTIGYRAADTPPPNPRHAENRRPAAEVVHHGRW